MNADNKDDLKGDTPLARNKAHTEEGAPTDKAHRDAGDGALTGSVPAGLSTEELRKVAESDKTDDGGTG
ncbi:hypothetical protein [Muricoccus radiodurans]|uniref:hypothetical protein n=1 Tax=Muricoccus radiodurans TaxID=2231721 RepID=UPI003CE89AF0